MAYEELAIDDVVSYSTYGESTLAELMAWGIEPPKKVRRSGHCITEDRTTQEGSTRAVFECRCVI